MFRKAFLYRITFLAVALILAATRLTAAGEDPCQSCGHCVEAFLSTLEDHGWLGMGVHLHDAADGERIEIQYVDDAGPAARAGLRSRDRILRIAELSTETASADRVVQRLFDIHPGEEVLFGIERNGRRFEVEVRAEEMGMRARAEALGSFLLRRLRQSGAIPREPQPDRTPSHP